MDFYDKNGTLLKIGDQITPDEGRVLTLISEGYVEDFGEVLFGQQVEDAAAFSILTQEDLSAQWTKTANAPLSEAEQALNILLGVE